MKVFRKRLFYESWNDIDKNLQGYREMHLRLKQRKKWWRTSKIRQRYFSSFVLWCNYTVVAFTFTRQILLWWRLSFFWLWFKSRFSQRKMSFFRIYATWKVNIPSTRKIGFLGGWGGERKDKEIMFPVCTRH
jgi:hypothetical protein